MFGGGGGADFPADAMKNNFHLAAFEAEEEFFSSQLKLQLGAICPNY